MPGINANTLFCWHLSEDVTPNEYGVFVLPDSSGNEILGYTKELRDTVNYALGTGASWSFDGVYPCNLTNAASSVTQLDGDFTIDFRVRFSTETPVQRGLLKSFDSDRQYHVSYKLDEYLTFVGNGQSVSASINLNYSQGYHFAFVRSGSTLYIFIDGILRASGTVSGTIGANTSLYIGQGYTGYHFGNLQEFRVQDVAVWTSDFPVPTSIYTNGSEYIETVTEALTLTGTPAHSAVWNQYETLMLGGVNLPVGPLYESFLEALGLQDINKPVGPMRESFAEALAVSDPSVNNGIFHFSFSETIGSGEVGGKYIEFTANQEGLIALSQSAGQMWLDALVEVIAFNTSNGVVQGTEQVLAFSDSVIYAISALLKTAFGIGDGVVVNYRALLSQAEVVRISQSCSVLHQTTVTPSEPSRGYITLFFPFVNPTVTVNLRNPVFGDTWSLQFNTIARTLMTGRDEVFRPSNRPVFQKLIYEFEMMENMSTFQAFCEATIGEEIGLVDMQNVTWRGAITSDPVEIQNFDQTNDRWSFTFEGKKA